MFEYWWIWVVIKFLRGNFLLNKMGKCFRGVKIGIRGYVIFLKNEEMVLIFIKFFIYISLF